VLTRRFISSRQLFASTLFGAERTLQLGDSPACRLQRVLASAFEGPGSRLLPEPIELGFRSLA